MAYEIDPQTGQIVWRGPGADPGILLPRSLANANPEQQLGYLQQQAEMQRPEPPSRPQLPAFAVDLPRAQQEAILRQQYEMAGQEYPSVSPLGPGTVGVSPDWRPSSGLAAGQISTGEPLDLSGIFAGLDSSGDGGYSPSLVDTSAAEAFLSFEETPQERAALESILADLEARAAAGVEAVRGGWSVVQAVNSAAARKAAEMARQAGPEAAALWTQAKDNVLNLSADVARAIGNIPGMQSVNISPIAGAGRIAALLAAEAPRAQALAERLGLATAEQIAAQGRTAAMMGEAFAGDITRTMLIQANTARQAHNKSVLDRTAKERQSAAQMRFEASKTNAALLSNAAAQAAAGASTPERRRQAIQNLDEDVRRYANADALEGEPRIGMEYLMGIYGFDAPTARALIMGAREGTLNWAAAAAAIGD